MSNRFITIAKLTLWVTAAFYAYGALVHILNMASVNGFDWPSAPLKWQVLDVVYLILDIVVAVGLVRMWRVSIAGFYLAALSQIALYTVGRPWVLDVPEAFRPDEQATAYLNSLVTFHLITLIAVTIALAYLSKRNATHSNVRVS